MMPTENEGHAFGCAKPTLRYLAGMSGHHNRADTGELERATASTQTKVLKFSLSTMHYHATELICSG